MPCYRLLARLICFLCASASLASDLASRTVRCQDTGYPYLLYAEAHTGPAPAVLLLHGAGDHAASFIENWTHLAHRKGAVLIAPEIPRDSKFEPVAPDVFRCIVDDARRQVAIDAARIYLFGHSMGGYLGFDAAMFQSDYFAAAAIHGSDIADDYVSILSHAKRKIPLAIYIGDNDPFFPLAHVRRTRVLLEKKGFPVHYVEVVGHGHSYYQVAEQVNADAWKFFAEHPYLETTIELAHLQVRSQFAPLQSSTLRKKYYPFNAFPVSAPIMFRLTSVLGKAHPLWRKCGGPSPEPISHQSPSSAWAFENHRGPHAPPPKLPARKSTGNAVSEGASHEEHRGKEAPTLRS